MDAFLTDETSCAMLRMSRYNAFPRTNECGMRTVSIDPGSQTQWWRHAVEELTPHLDINAQHPLCVLVPDAKSRTQSRLVRSTICSTVLPQGSFLTAELNDEDGILAIQSPAYSYASLAHILDAACRKGKLTYLEARAILLSYGYELCGTYARDAKHPLSADCHYKLEPAATPEELANWCATRSGRACKGIELARKCAAEVLAKSASPAETIHAIVFTSAPELGGLGMSDILMNHSLNLDSRGSELVHRIPLTPDLTFPQLSLVLEHQGGNHDEVQRYREDASRTQDYAALGQRVLMTSANDFVSPQAYDSFLRRFFAAVAHDYGASVASPYLRILENADHTFARHELLTVLTDHIHDPWSW